MNITVIILTFNEEIHLARCIESIMPLTSDILVVDSYSSDKTIEIARNYNARVLQRAWDNNHSNQFNWALTQLDPNKTQWVFRLDADEIVTPELISQLRNSVSILDDGIVGILFNRIIYFQGKQIKYGGVGSNLVSRFFRYGYGKSESRWMDEHIKINGNCIKINESIIDNNLNSISWWIDKHNNYSSREVLDLLNLKYKISKIDSVSNSLITTTISKKRWIKEHVYAKLPLGFRAFMYFAYRYIVLGGIFDGSVGAQFHFLQAFWYRYLVDIKFKEVEKYMMKNSVPIQVSIAHVLRIKID